MRITISHTRPKQQVMQSIDRCFDDLFRGTGVVPIQLVDEKRTWRGSTLDFLLSAKMGPMTSPIKGTIDVTDTNVTLDVDLGILERLLPAATVKETLTNRVRGLLT